MVRNTEEARIAQTVGENLNVKGNLTIEKITQIGKQTVIQGEVAFEEVSLEQFQSERLSNELDIDTLSNLSIIKELTNSALTQNIVFIAKDRKIKKANLARLVAYLIKQNKNISISSIKESFRNLNIGLSLQRELCKTEVPTVFILTDVSFSSFGASLNNIRELARQNQHYVICATDDAKETWQVGNDLSCYENLFDDLKDCRYLVNELSEEESIRQWYEDLESREQLLAIALSLFDNSYGDQFFAALEELVEEEWQCRDPGLRALDYCDLRNLYAFFSFSGKTEQEETVEVTSSKERRLLLKVSWKSHRRQIINALPILAALVKGSVNSFYYELYGTEERRTRLRQIISEALSDVSLIANNSKVVEDVLLSLVAAERIEVQAVAANALAQWRIHEKQDLIREIVADGLNREVNEPDERLFEIIKRWQNNYEVERLVGSYLGERNDANSRNATDYIKSTVALTIGYASEFDLPDQMSEELLTLLRSLVKDKSHLVQDRLFSDTLPRIIRRHTEQLRNELKDFLSTSNPALIIAISKSLANAYKFRPDAVLSILEAWQSEAESNRPSRVFRNKITAREALLSTVAMTYGELESLGDNKIFENLQRILAEEVHPTVRSYAIAAVGRQAQKNFGPIEPQLRVLLNQTTKDERNALAELFADIYVFQRYYQSGGDETVKIQGRDYSVWLYSHRPLTTIEEAMLRWAKDDSNVMAQQIATRASAISAARLDREEARQVEELKKKLGIRKVELFEECTSPVLGGQAPQDWYLGKLVPWLVTRTAESYRLSIRNLLPEGLFQHRKSSENINFVLRKWHDSSDSDIRIIAGRLKPGILLAENLKWGMAGAALITIGVLSVNVDRLQSRPNIVSEPPVPIDPGITLSDRIGVSDVDSPTFDGGQLTVQFAENGTANDRLGIRSQGKGQAQIYLSGNTVLYGNNVLGQLAGGEGTETLVISFTPNATPEAVQALMRNITFHNVADSPEPGLRKINFQVTDDAGASSEPLTRTVFVTAENQTPKILVPQAQAASENVPLKISGISFEDPDSTKNLVVVLSVDQGAITVSGSIPKGLQARNITNNNSREVRLTGNAEQIKSTLTAPGAITYKGAVDAKFNIVVNDGGLDIPADAGEALIWPLNSETARENQAAFQITVAPSNKIPTIAVSEPQVTVSEDGKLEIGNISVNDPDSAKLSVILSVEQGTLYVKADVAQGLTGKEISGNQSNRVVLSGDRNKIQTTLMSPQAITYAGNPDFYGNDSLKIEVDDNGRGNASVISINVTPVNDLPVLSIAPPVVAPAPAPPPEPTQNTNSTNATVTGDPSQRKNIRAGITTDAQVLFELPVGSRVRVLDSKYNADNYLWYKIYSPQYQREGWIASHLLQLDQAE